MLTTDRGPAPRSLGGTDIAAILGFSKWKSPLDVYLRRRGLAEPRDPDEPIPDRFVLGNAFEEPVFQVFRDRHPEITDSSDPGNEAITVHDSDLFDQLEEDPDDPDAHHAYRLQSREHEFLGGTPDRFTIYDGESRVYDSKTAHPYTIDSWGPTGTDQVPPDVLFQAHGYLILTGFEACDVGVAFGNAEFREYTIKPDAELHEVILFHLDRFWWDNIIGGEQPAIDGSESWKRYLLRRHPSALSEHRDITEAELVHAEAWRSLKGEIKELDKLVAEHKNALMASIGDAAGLYMPDGKKINFGERKGATSWKKIAEDLAGDRDLEDLIEKHRGNSSRPIVPPRGW